MASQCTMRLGRAFRDFTHAVELNKIAELSEAFNKALKLSRKLAKQSIKLRSRNFTLNQLIEQEDLFQFGLKIMEASQWKEAAKAFQASIAMRDCLPQPWGNLGICLMMQERYDEAEAALKHALKIDSKYAIAKHNLSLLAETRRVGPPAMIALNDPFRPDEVEQAITFSEG